MQLLIDPNDFFIVQDKMFATLNKINNGLLWPSLVIMVLIFLTGFRMVRFLDVLALGRYQAINLGLTYNCVVRIFLILIAMLVSVSTLMVGPITFLGLLVTNLTYELFKTHKHSVIITACFLITGIALLIEQFLWRGYLIYLSL